jgi:serine phosphatase RsbU (regulator of sigma subunit)
MVSTVNDACVEWATARAVAHGHRDSGDEFCVRPFEYRTLIAVLDGLGHGPAAATVARQGVRLLEQAQTPDVVRLVHECHDGLRGSRGLVMSLAMFDAPANTMTWVGVGNVCGTLWRPSSSQRQTLLLRSGLVGDVLPRLQESVIPVSEGDTLVFTTDGVTEDIDDRVLQSSSLQGIADRILAYGSKGRDDALALVARYRGATR